jgi:hypothetical protein
LAARSLPHPLVIVTIANKAHSPAGIVHLPSFIFIVFLALLFIEWC